MQIDKLSSTNAFIVTDLDGAPQAAGAVRAAKKVLQGSTTALARTATYTFASRGLKVSGASAGISVEAGERAEAVAAFVSEVAPRVTAGELVLDPGSGVETDELAELDAADARDAVRLELVDGLPLQQHLEALGAVVAAEAALGGLDGVTVVVEQGPVARRLVRELAARGATIVGFGGAAGVVVSPDGLDSGALVDSDDPLAALATEPLPGAALTSTAAKVLFCGTRQGMIDGGVAESVPVELIVPTGCQPVSAKGLAVLRRRDVLALADFLTLSGPTYAGWPAGASSVDEVIASASTGIAERVAESLESEDGPLLGACYAAERFLASWQTTLPFGRPLA